MMRCGSDPYRGASEGSRSQNTARPLLRVARWILPAATLEVFESSALQSSPGEMQRDTLLVSSSAAPNSAVAVDQDASTSDDPSKSETGPYTCPQTMRKPSMSKVILRAVADKGTHRRVSLAALKKAVSITGYDMAHNSWRFKRAVENLVKKGMLKQVTGKGASGSFRLGKKQAFKSKRKAKRRQRRQQRRKPRQRRSGPSQSLLGSRKSHKGLYKGVHRGARGRRH
ncbi:spermatid-specific linker histone H1-like protein [Onychomys torridus]|uniref:spermatid-specific linker histone H1-like protein n=1 Tax=Onychomys torridus TaxID=38674 RepID=UPI00167F54F0|nr:spermatid-specific linker histone H1-like protein [Onychomys torridus]